MTKNIIMIGAGGFASECYEYLQDVMKTDANINFKGFLSTSNDLHSYGLENYFLGHYDDYAFQKNDFVVIAIGSCYARKKIYEALKERNVNFYSLISPKAFIPNPEVISECTIIAPFVTVAMNVNLGIGNVVGALSGIGHDTNIGDFNVFSSHTDICGFSKIGNHNFFGSRVSVLPKAKIGNNNKIAAGSVIYKICRDNSVMQGNPAVKISNVEDL